MAHSSDVSMKLPDNTYRFPMYNCRYTEYPHPLHFAAAIGKEPGVLKNLVNWYGVNVVDDKNRMPLMFAAVGNKVP